MNPWPDLRVRWLEPVGRRFCSDPFCGKPALPTRWVCLDCADKIDKRSAALRKRGPLRRNN